MFPLDELNPKPNDSGDAGSGIRGYTPISKPTHGHGSSPVLSPDIRTFECDPAESFTELRRGSVGENEANFGRPRKYGQIYTLTLIITLTRV